MTALGITIPKRLPVAELLLVLVAIFWGTSYGVTKEALLVTSVLTFLAIRFTITFLIMLPILLKDLAAGKATGWPYAIITGLILLGVFLAETFGVKYTSASNAAFLISLSVLLTPFIEWFVFRVFPGWRLCMWVLVFLIGTYLLVLNADSRLELNLGDGLILMAALLRGVMVVATKKWVVKESITTLSLTAVQMGVVAFGVLVMLFVVETDLPDLQVLPGSFWLAILYLVLCCTMFAFFAQNYGVRHTSPSRAALLMGTEPAFGGLFAVFWLGETLSSLQLVGAFLVVTAALAGARR